MAWIEQRSKQFRVYERTVDGHKAYEPFATREDAALFIQFAALRGWDAAIAAVRQPCPAEGVVPPATSPAPAPTTESLPATGTAAATPLGTATAPAAATMGGSTDHGQLRSRMHARAPEGLQAAGITVGALVRLHISGLVGVEHDTADQYRAYVRDYVDPFFGDLDAGYVIAKPHPDGEGTCATPVTEWRAWLAEQPAVTRKGPHATRTLSGKTKHNIMSAVSAAYNTAMASDFRQLVSRNPFRGGARGIKGQDTTERTYLTAEQARAMHDALLPGYRLLFMFLVLTGLRWAEASGLRVKDVCLEPTTGRPHLDVKVGLKRLKGGGWVLGRLKRQAARRRLTLPASLVEPMRALLEGKQPEDLAFTSVGGKPLHHSNFCREITRAVLRATLAGHQVPDFTPHALRHTCATWLLTSGRTLYQVSKQLGHESEATTGRYYGHVLAENRDENAATLDIALGGHWLPAELDRTSVTLSAADLLLPEMCLATIDAAEARAA